MKFRPNKKTAKTMKDKPTVESLEDLQDQLDNSTADAATYANAKATASEAEEEAADDIGDGR